MQTIVLCVGLPGSGKTSSSDLFIKRPGIKANVIHVEDWLSANNEHLRDRYGNSFLHDDTWPNMWRHAKDVVSQYGGVLILDLWLPNPKRRKEVATELREVFGETEIICWHFVTPGEVCKERYVQRQLVAEEAEGKSADEPEYVRRSGLKFHWELLERQYEPVADDEVGPVFDDIFVLNNETERVMG